MSGKRCDAHHAHLPKVPPAARVPVRVDELLFLSAESVRRLLHDPVLDPSLVTPRGAQLKMQRIFSLGEGSIKYIIHQGVANFRKMLQSIDEYLKIAERSHGEHDADGEPQPEEDADERAERERDLGLGAGAVVVVPRAVQAVVKGRRQGHGGVQRTER